MFSKLNKILADCDDVLHSSSPEDIDSFIDDENLVEKAIEALSDITGGVVSKDDELQVLEALNGINFFNCSFKDKSDIFSLRFISTPVPIVILDKLTGSEKQTIIFSRNEKTVV